MTRIIPLPLPIVNAYLLQDSRPMLVDTGRPQDAAQIRNLLAQHNVAPQDLALILQTHGHWDHCGSTRQFKQWTSAPAAIHAADAAMMRRGDNGILKPVTWIAWALKPLLDRHFPGVEPDILITEEIDLKSYGIDARILFTPGHTAGSISIFTAAGDVLVGDLVMGGCWGGRLWPTRPGYHYFADDFTLLRSSIRKVLDLKPSRIFPAHGGPLDPKRVERLA